MASLPSSKYLYPLTLLLIFVFPLLFIPSSQYLNTLINSLSNNPLQSNPQTPTTTTSHLQTINTADMSASKLSFDALLPFIKNRRSIYALTKNLPISKARIQHLVNETTLHTPSSFNSQSNRVVVLFDEEHDKFWEITRSALRAKVPDDKWQATADRLAGFSGAAGTIMFFHDEDAVKALQEKMPTYAQNFPPWALQSLGMQQWLLWAGLEAEGLGANLQHYNPLVDEEVRKTWGLPEGWKLNAQMVFGGLKGGPLREKEFKPLEERVKYFGLDE